MALLQVNFMAKSLMRIVTMQVILPVDKITNPGMSLRENKPYKTLYLLHGIYGNNMSWISGSRIQRLAEEKDLVVVMPSGDNGFYVDRPTSYDLYGEFIGNELVEITRKMFPLSGKREDTFIAGLSMGGFGALRNGLKYHETFGCIAALSSALVLEQALNYSFNEPHITRNRSYFESCFGDLNKALESDNNPKMLVKTLKEKTVQDLEVRFPEIYMACGTEDILIENNRDFRNFLKENNIDFTYVEGPGIHDWDFWDAYIKKALDWLPLENASIGLND